MQAEIKRVRNPINAIDNPKTPIEHEGRAAEENLTTIKDKSGEGVLPAIKVKAPK